MTTIEREYQYQVGRAGLVACVIFFSALAFAMLLQTLTNDTRDMIFHGGVAGGSALIVAISVALLSVRQRIALTSTALLVPQSPRSQKEIEIPYKEICNLSMFERRGQMLLHVACADLNCTIESSLLPSKESFHEVSELLVLKVRAAQEAGLARFSPALPSTSTAVTIHPDDMKESAPIELDDRLRRRLTTDAMIVCPRCSSGDLHTTSRSLLDGRCCFRCDCCRLELAPLRGRIALWFLLTLGISLTLAGIALVLNVVSVEGSWNAAMPLLIFVTMVPAGAGFFVIYLVRELLRPTPVRSRDHFG